MKQLLVGIPGHPGVWRSGSLFGSFDIENSILLIRGWATLPRLYQAARGA